MICPYCKAENQKSCITPGPTSSTLMATTPGHYDEDGKWVRAKDPNWHTTEYYCSRGHRFTEMRREGDEPVMRLVSTLTSTVSA